MTRYAWWPFSISTALYLEFYMHPVPCDTTSACSLLHLTLPRVSHNSGLCGRWPFRLPQHQWNGVHCLSKWGFCILRLAQRLLRGPDWFLHFAQMWGSLLSGDVRCHFLILINYGPGFVWLIDIERMLNSWSSYCCACFRSVDQRLTASSGLVALQYFLAYLLSLMQREQIWSFGISK